MTDLNKDFKVPFIPTELPFNDSQQQWLGGFLAGLHSQLLVKENTTGQQAIAVAPRPLTIIYGSQTGNAESVAYECAEHAKTQGLTPHVLDMDDVELSDLAKTERLLVVTSTYGEGEMPDNAQALWDAISTNDAPTLTHTHYSVLALGDTNYDDFCLSGKQWDQRLEALGAQRIAARVDCDVDYENLAENWIAEAVPTIAQKGSDASGTTIQENSSAKKKSQYGRKNPIAAELTSRRVLTTEKSSKEIYHVEFSLAGSGESYNAGDALNVIACNQPELVTLLLKVMACTGNELMPWQGNTRALQELLTNELEIRTPSKDLLAEIALRSGDSTFNKLLSAENHDALNDFLYGKDIVDLLQSYHQAEFSAAELITLLKPIAPRAYSISSSINKHEQEVHLTISSVRYEQDGRQHAGVCSTYLKDLAEVGDKVKIYFAPNKNFSVPENDDLPIIMVGPGTGIAPFRAFLEEREARNAKGNNWLFFGDRNCETDFIYRDEIEAMQSSGLLTHLDLAFSRDQAGKIYVQDRMREQGAALFEWFERGAYFYICGDAYHMAKDVDKALHDIIAEHGNLSSEDANHYVDTLKKTKRYVRDVY
jgi:sulfite reductase (NADPH) flavoprotein alpha-component